jgi:coatomer subunit beta
MSTYLDYTYSLVHQDNSSDIPDTNALKQALEKGNVRYSLVHKKHIGPLD